MNLGASCCKSPDMVWLGIKVAEVRKFLSGYSNTKFWDAVKKCINGNIYLIVTACTHDGKTGHYPDDMEWRSFIESLCIDLSIYKANKNNCRITISNEPMKFMTREQYAHLVNLAYAQIAGRFKMGVGNEEFTLAESKGNMYPYILQNCKFDILDIHIQTSCTTESNCIKYTNQAYAWGRQYNKPVDCTEAFYSDIATADGYNTLLMQLKHAERIGCPNFPMVFINLDSKAFPFDVAKWKKLAFFYNGVQRSPYWNDYVRIINEKYKPIIPIEEDDDMKLDKIYNVGSRGIGVKFIQMVLNEDIKPDPLLVVDGIWGSKTNAIVLAYQKKYNLSQYAGAIGGNTMQQMINLYPAIWNKTEYLWAIGVR
jgi:hypothetical protein